MKEELKTLKDLEHSEDLKHQDSKLVYSWKLKAEAVKDIKFMKNCGCKECLTILPYVMWKNNLTEEDLK